MSQSTCIGSQYDPRSINPYNVQIPRKHNTTETNFPYNIYGAEMVHGPAYFTRDIVNPAEYSQHEWLMNALPPVHGKEPNPRRFQRWGWTHFPNGYGIGNFKGHLNCGPGCDLDQDPIGYVTEKTQRTIDYFACARRYRWKMILYWWLMHQ